MEPTTSGGYVEPDGATVDLQVGRVERGDGESGRLDRSAWDGPVLVFGRAAVVVLPITWAGC